MTGRDRDTCPNKRGTSYRGKQERPFPRDGKRNRTRRRTEDGRVSYHTKIIPKIKDSIKNDKDDTHAHEFF